MADKPSKSKTKKPAPPKTEAPKADAAAPEGESQAADLPPLMVLAQYIRDLSFENPSAPAHTAAGDTPPHVSINVNVNANALSDTEYEVSLTMEAEAKNGDDTVFIAELVYGGVFRLNNLPAEHVQPVLMIECPRLLFPFARNILADVTRDGGFPPLLVQPIDFVALYQQQQAEMAGQTPQA